MHTQWLFISGPAAGQTLFVASGLRDVTVDVDGALHDYAGHIVVMGGKRYMLGIQRSLDTESIVWSDVSAQLQKHSVEPME